MLEADSRSEVREAGEDSQAKRSPKKTPEHKARRRREGKGLG